MYTHPEIARDIAGQRIQKMHTRARIDRQQAEARSVQRSSRTWKSWLRSLGTRPAIRYRPRSA